MRHNDNKKDNVIIILLLLSARLIVQLFRFSVVLVDGLPRFQVNLVKVAFFSSG